jgi:poly-gamma-glutamate synthesis protein (capsule biosynthesis protein)
MFSGPFTISWKHIRLLIALAMVWAAVSPSVRTRAQQQPLNVQQELKMKIKGPYTFVAVGDLNYVHPVTQLSDPTVQEALDVIRSADAAFGNMEANIADYRNYKGPIDGTTGDKGIAADVKDIGIKIVNRANNHTTEGGVQGMLETSHWLQEAGIVYAGVGKDLSEARAAQYVETHKGRVGLVGMYSISSTAAGNPGAATYKFGDVGGLPGLDPLHLTMYQIVSQQQLDSLRKIRDDMYSHSRDVTNPVPAIPANDPPDRVRLSRVGSWYKAGTTPGGLSYTMNPDDLREILRSIRNGKEYSDYMIATIHTHEDVSSLKLQFFSETPTDFLVELAHKTIDNGADVFVGHGIHVLRGIELYKGKPIFYGLSSFVYQLNQQVTPLDRYTEQKQNPFATDITDDEAQWKYWDSYERPRMVLDNMDSVIAECKYDNAELHEIILHPIDLGYSAPQSQQGIPHVPSPENAQRILQKLQKLSAPFGTNIAIENNLGVIRIGSAVSGH